MRRSMWAMRLFPRGLAAVSLLLQPGLDARAAIANVAADAVAPWALTTMTPAVEAIHGYPEHCRRIDDRHQSLVSNLVHGGSLSVGGSALAELCVPVWYGCRTLKATPPRERSAESTEDLVEVGRMMCAKFASSDPHWAGSNPNRSLSGRAGVARGLRTVPDEAYESNTEWPGGDDVVAAGARSRSPAAPSGT
jgi:hypothetical protein